MARLPKTIYDAVNQQNINNLPEIYDYLDERYWCKADDAFSGRLEITKSYPRVRMVSDYDKIRDWAKEIQIDKDCDKCKLYYDLHEIMMPLVKYLQIPSNNRKELFRMFRTSTINKTNEAIEKHRGLLDWINENWIAALLDIQKVIQEIVEKKIKYYETNLSQFKDKTKRYGYNLQMTELLMPVVKMLTDKRLSKSKALMYICDLLVKFDIKDLDSYNLKHYIK